MNFYFGLNIFQLELFNCNYIEYDFITIYLTKEISKAKR